MQTLRSRVTTELLPFVDHPGQYIGREINQLVSDGDWARAEVRLAIAFPDTYSIGMSHLGCQILYWIVNHTPGCCAERVYCPKLDAESIMRQKSIELFTWDTRRPVSTADILAISLQQELAYSSVLQLLDLANMPLRSAHRDDRHPIVLAGGPQADNPEPIAPFIDLVVLGDGEPAIAEILTACKEYKAGRMRRRDMIPALARRFPWVYAPSLYEHAYNADGTLQRLKPVDDGIPPAIERCHASNLEETPFPTRLLVPHIEIVHDRMAVEIMRGCPRHCRFCHAGNTKRPVRLRSVDRVLELAEQMYRSTGMDELGLLSLSTSDYPYLRQLVERAHDRFDSRRVNISVPSLRIDKMLQEIPSMVSSVRKGGLTMAVEAANPEMRDAIRKHVLDGDLLDGVKEAYKAGWRTVKLYFVCGFPGERPEDIDGIVHLSREVSELRRELGKGPAQINAAVSWLVPKPHTPLQWAAQPPAEYFHEARRRMHDLLGTRRRRRKGPIKLKTHSVERSVLEAVFARGDRKLADAVEHAYKAGARFDAWGEHFDETIWTRAFDATGIDPAFYAHRNRSADEILPWAHLHSGPPTENLMRQYVDFLGKVGRSWPTSAVPGSGPSNPGAKVCKEESGRNLNHGSA
ncbi:MAG: TIGR03960 family B12-binding radical SAM protein [Phycisphaerales bacterium]|nr:MAG: TIGR03960 family B12-binding radical SAM protein [Phycisphaerales bacterium]